MNNEKYVWAMHSILILFDGPHGSASNKERQGGPWLEIPQCIGHDKS